MISTIFIILAIIVCFTAIFLPDSAFNNLKFKHFDWFILTSLLLAIGFMILGLIFKHFGM